MCLSPVSLLPNKYRDEENMRLNKAHENKEEPIISQRFWVQTMTYLSTNIGIGTGKILIETVSYNT